MRRVAREKGISVVGVLGLIFGAVDRGILSVEEARSTLRDAVGIHGLRISVDLYQRVLDRLEG